eukprot:scaffold3641_cov120-Cylindrotheca_fusiformis.AAC.1
MGVWRLAPSIVWGSGLSPQRVQRAEPLRGLGGGAPRKFCHFDQACPWFFQESKALAFSSQEKLLFFEDEDCADNDSLFWVIQSVMVRVMREACNWKMMSLKELCPAKHSHQGSL